MKVFFTNPRKEKLAGILEEPSPEKSIVLLVHGSATSKNSPNIEAVASELTRRNMNTFRIDLAGCGESEGSYEKQTISSHAEDVLSAVHYLRKRGYKTIDLFGSSRGGTTVMAAALRDSTIHRIALKAPVSDYQQRFTDSLGVKGIERWRKLGYKEELRSDGTLIRMNFDFYVDAKQYTMYNKVHGIRCPVLIIHGNADEDVDVRQSERVIAGFPNGRLIILNGADHKLAINGDKTLANRLFGCWFAGDME